MEVVVLKQDNIKAEKAEKAEKTERVKQNEFAEKHMVYQNEENNQGVCEEKSPRNRL